MRIILQIDGKTITTVYKEYELESSVSEFMHAFDQDVYACFKFNICFASIYKMHSSFSVYFHLCSSFCMDRSWVLLLVTLTYSYPQSPQSFASKLIQWDFLQ